MWLILLLFVCLSWIFFSVRKSLKYWDTRKVPNQKFISDVLARPQTRAQDIYRAYPNKRYVGMYLLLKPTLVIRDPELIKQMSITWFDAFPEHSTFASKTLDPLWNKNLFAMKVVDGWHDARLTLSPSFTSSKLKLMYDLIKNCAEELTKHLKQQPGAESIEVKDLFSRFSVDVIGTTAFGITSNSFQDPNNQFYLMGQDVVNFNGIRALKILAFAAIPSVMKLLDVGVFSKQVSGFFRGLIKETIRIREEKQVIRPDMIHLLMEARKGCLKYDDIKIVNDGFAVVEESDLGRTLRAQKAVLTDDDITGLALGFFFAGFDTTSTALCFLAYELALNPDIQEKLNQEIKGVAKGVQGEIAYETLVRMKYLDMVVSETLRKWPPVAVTNRISIKPVTLEPEQANEEPVYLEIGTVCWIPIHSIHRDSKYYPQPDRFDPERFSDENKHTIKPFTYFPFGAGPRSCIGSRFALLQIKLAIVEILKNFEVVPVAKTLMHLPPSASGFGPLPKEGIWLGFTPKASSCNS